MSPDWAKRLQKLRELQFEAFEYGGEVWWYHSEDLWYWESEVAEVFDESSSMELALYHML